MSYANWLAYLASAEKHSVISGNSRKVYYKFPDGKQMAEEYSMETGVIQRRAWCKQRQLIKDEDVKWELELGEEPKQIGDRGESNEFTLCEANTEPMLSKRLTKKNVEWRIRNLPYPIGVYQVSVDTERRAIVVRTSNKKFYKVIEIPELNRCNLLPEQNELSIHHQYNTLIITYRKPPLLCELEAKTLLLLKDVETESNMDDILQGLLSK